jgi:putative transposase
MPTNRRFEFDWLDHIHRDTSFWPTIDESMLTDELKLIVNPRAGAVQDYVAGRPLDEILEKHGKRLPEVIRLTKRCVQIHPDGRIWGFRALLPFKHLKQYERGALVQRRTLDEKSGCSGALLQLFDLHPNVRETVDNLYLKQRKKDLVHESRIPLKSIHKRFLDICRAEGVMSEQYPFCVKNLGRIALFRYLQRLESTQQQLAAAARFGKAAARKLRASASAGQDSVITYPYQQVQCDGHRIDLMCVIDVPSPHGGVEKRVLSRFWILCIIDVLTRAILGYWLCLRREYNANDVLRCIKNSIVPWKPKTFTIPNLRYPSTAGFPSGVIPKAEYALWDDLLYDNAKANLSDRTRQKLLDLVGCEINAGQIENPDRRAIIERFFRTLEENGYHRIPSTTGSKPSDPRRQKPEQTAVALNIKFEHLQELTDVVIARYNGTPHSALGGRSPLEQLRYFTDRDDFLLRTVPERNRNDLTLFNFNTTRVVRGNVEKGTAPYIEYLGVRYRSEVLVRTPELIGVRLDLSINPDDLRSITTYLPDGSELGLLIAHGFWGRTPHTIEMRDGILDLKNRQLISYTEDQDAIHIYMDHLEAEKRKGSANKLAEARMALATTRAPLGFPQEATTLIADRPESPTPQRSTKRKSKLPSIIRKTLTF